MIKYITVFNYADGIINYHPFHANDHYITNNMEKYVEDLGYDDDEVFYFISDGIDIDESALLDSEPNFGYIAVGDIVNGLIKILPLTEKEYNQVEYEDKLVANGFDPFTAVWMTSKNEIEYIVHE